MEWPIKFLPTALSVGSSLVVLLWWMSAQFNSLKIEQVHLTTQLHSQALELMKIKKEIEPIPLQSQMLLAHKTQISQIHQVLTLLNLKSAGINKIFQNYINKDYFYRTMDSMKENFRTINQKVYLNSQEINFLRGQRDAHL